MSVLAFGPSDSRHQTVWSIASTSTRVDFRQKRFSFVPDRTSGRRSLRCESLPLNGARDTRLPTMSLGKFPSRLDTRVPVVQVLPLSRPRDATGEAGQARFVRPLRRESLPQRSSVLNTAPVTESKLESAEEAASREHLSFEWETETLMDTASNSVEDSPRTQYPCPFRKRNPVRFNVRDHGRCANAPFNSMYELRCHLVSHHRRKRPRYHCRRCLAEFEAEAALERHMMLPRDEMCEVNPKPALGDPENGITEETEEVLTADGTTYAEDWTWERIWRLLFPQDTEIPHSDFQPVIELAEVDHVFDQGQEALKASLREKLRLLLPDTIDDHYCSFVTGQLDLIFETHRADMMRKSLALCGSTSAGESVPIPPRRPNRRSRRSTLLQPGGIPHRSHPVAPDQTLAAVEETRASVTRRHGIASFIPVTLKTGKQPPAHHHGTGTAPLSSIQHPFGEARPSLPPADLETTTTLPRDPRDSGIGMPCDICECEPDQCKCRSSSGSSSSSTALCRLQQLGKEQHTVESEPKRGSSELSEYVSPTGSSTRSLPSPGQVALAARQELRAYKPTLRVNTRVLDGSATEDGFGTVMDGCGHGDGDVCAGGGERGFFSPQSFKQRVLRQQLMGN